MPDTKHLTGVEKRKQRQQLASIQGVALMRAGAIGIAIAFAFRGDWMGVGLMIGVIFLSHLLLPVKR